MARYRMMKNGILENEYEFVLYQNNIGTCSIIPIPVCSVSNRGCY